MSREDRGEKSFLESLVYVRGEWRRGKTKALGAGYTGGEKSLLRWIKAA